VKKVLKDGGEFILCFVGRRILNASSILPMIYKYAQDIGFQQIPLSYQINSSATTANFRFSIIIAWKVPVSHEAPTQPKNTISKQQGSHFLIATHFLVDDEEFLRMFEDPKAITDD
jgi:hypothetical protein